MARKQTAIIENRKYNSFCGNDGDVATANLVLQFFHALFEKATR